MFGRLFMSSKNCQSCIYWNPENNVRFSENDSYRWTGWGWCRKHDPTDGYIFTLKGGTDYKKIGFLKNNKYMTFYTDLCTSGWNGSL